MAKAAKETSTLLSSAGSGFFYTNRKNKKKSKGDKKLNLKKYDPVLRKHVLFEDKKLSKRKAKKAAPAAAAAEGKAATAEAK